MPYVPVNFFPFLATPVMGVVNSGPASVNCGTPPVGVAAPAVGAPNATSARLAPSAANKMRSRISPPFVGVPDWAARSKPGLRTTSSGVDASARRATVAQRRLLGPDGHALQRPFDLVRQDADCAECRERSRVGRLEK